MSGWAAGPLVGFDLETTSPEPEDARIVTAAIVWRGTLQDGEAGWLVCPEVEIPAEAAGIHGITTERARAEGMDPRLAAAQIGEHLRVAMAARWPLVIFNAPYDLTVLDRETRRFGLAAFGEVFREHGGLVIDPFVLDKHLDRYRRGRRTLTAACEHYGVTLDGAHQSGADVIAAMRLAWKIAHVYPAIAQASLADLQVLQARAKAMQAASFQDYLRRQGSDEVVDGSWPLHKAPAVTR